MRNFMLRAVLVEPGRIEFKEVEVPTPGPDEIVMKVERIGICGSDVHAYHGLHPNARYPLIQGHESSGTVYLVGENVNQENFKPGDKITFMPQIVCGKCYLCQRGMYHICESLRVMGFQPPGSAQEYFVLPEANVVKLPDDIAFEAGALVEPISVAVHAVSRAKIESGQRVIVLGAGPIGNLVGQVAKARGATVLSTDLSDFRLGLARRCGIDITVNPQKEDLTQAIQTHFGPDKADVIFECVGIQATVEQAVRNARKGSPIVIVGVFGKKPVVDMMLVQNRELSLVGSQMYRRVDYGQAIQLIAENKLHLDELITHHFNLVDYPEAYRYIERNQDKAMKVMIRL
jgi:L-iditol 2-dehydrogenase